MSRSFAVLAMLGGIPEEAMVISMSFFAMITVIALGIPFIRALAKRWDRAPLPPASDGDTTARLERIEQAVEAVAIEVERIAEAQRFAVKLMAEQPRARLPNADSASS